MPSLVLSFRSCQNDRDFGMGSVALASNLARCLKAPGVPRVWPWRGNVISRGRWRFLSQCESAELALITRLSGRDNRGDLGRIVRPDMVC